MNIWSVGDKIGFIAHFDLKKEISCVKYLEISEEKKYLGIIIQNEVHFYNFIDDKPQLVKTLECQALIHDFEYVAEENRIVTVGEEDAVKVWDGNTWEVANKIEKEKLEIEGPIFTVICMKDKRNIALEHQKGLLITDLQGEEVEPYWVDYKEGRGLGYLPESERFIMNISKKETYLLDANDFSLHTKFMKDKLFDGKNEKLQFVLNQDESQVVSRGDGPYLQVYGNKNIKRGYCGGLIGKIGGIEALLDLNRLAIADENKGIINIFITNYYKSIWTTPEKWVQGLGKKPPQPKKKKVQSKQSKNKKDEDVIEEEKFEEKKEEKMEIEDPKQKEKKGVKKRSNSKKETKKETKRENTKRAPRGESKKKEKKVEDEDRSRSRSKSKSTGRAEMKEKEKANRKSSTKPAAKKKMNK